MRSWNTYISLTPSIAYSQGESEADSAAEALLAADYSVGYGIVYYDLEPFYNESGCQAAATAFVNGWVTEMTLEQPYYAGVYGSSCASYLSNYTTGNGLNYAPSDIAPGDVKVPPVAGVYNLDCLSNSLWDDNQRVAQFAGPVYDLVFGGTNCRVRAPTMRIVLMVSSIRTRVQ